MNAKPVPVTLLTGFLGSGKSTLLTEVLRDPRFSRTAVVINEFGEVALDGFLVEHSDEQIIEMTSGCLCCTIRGDIRETLLDLHQRREQGDIPSFDRLVVETTGLADPAPVIHTLMTDISLASRYTLAGVVTTVDTVNAESSLARYEECVKQVAVADRIVLTKTDLAKDPASRTEVKNLQAAIRRLNPGALLVDRNDASFDSRHLFDCDIYDPATKGRDVLQWLNAEAYQSDHPVHHDHSGHDNPVHHDHSGHDHDVNRHGTEVQAFSLVVDEPISTMAFTIALELLIGSKGADLLRVKGIVNLAEKPENPVVIHGVQHVFSEPVWLDEWPTEDRRTKLVFITRNIPQETLETYFTAWQSYGGAREEIRPETRQSS